MARIDPKEVRRMLDRGYVANEDAKIIADICDMVYASYFTHMEVIYEDLVQEATLGIVRLVDEGNFDENKGDVLTFVYSRARNCMSNYIYHENKEAKKVGEDSVNYRHLEDKDDTHFGYVSEEKVYEIRKFVTGKIKELGLTGLLASCVETYFNDKIGVKHKPITPTNFSIDFVEKYRYYVNTLEYMIIKQFMNNRVFDNKVSDIVDVLESEKEIDFYMKMFLDSLSKEQLTKMLYAFSSNTFILPSKYKLLKVDTYLNIYKTVAFNNMTVEDAAKTFDKPVSTIQSIVEKYSSIFS